MSPYILLYAVSLVLNELLHCYCSCFSAVAITEAELLAMNDKTNRHLRLRELVMENSLEANLVVM
jgi:solute carrier family 12 sodium/potassium/chloride transporter 2